MKGLAEKKKSGLLISAVFFVLACPCALAEEFGSKLAPDFTGVEIEYRADGCSYRYSPINFCDERHLKLIKDALKNNSINFGKKYILVSIPERKRFFENSLVAIDAETGVAYPFPFDFYSGKTDKAGNSHGDGIVHYAINSDQVCIDGSIMAYKEMQNGHLCWKFDAGRFVGQRTPYLD
ncbi:hypothetical protein [Xanthomonas oryzae]|uniref:hypothetical protein n=1 Tax=Xanthomonas oryzae TaxID=347 RepID=UPI001034FF93|nr:hypothetical protein [Xanthomonas oryzae]QBG94623.1 hypothetical protein EYC55_02765 [Xanthomonas oryzae]QBH01333.1 hypothetical protein EYC56_21300 [Xanthomonas oryzae]